MTAPDRLRESLHDLADRAQPADLYAGAVRRSRGIARREATVGTAAALVALAVLASGLWRNAPRSEPPEVQVALRSPVASPIEPATPVLPSPVPTTPAAAPLLTKPATATARRKNQPMLAVGTPVPQSRALADLPGHVFYEQTGDRPDVVKLFPADGEASTVLSGAPSAVGVSPDGRRIAYARDGNLLVARTGGGEPDRLATGVSSANQAPTWSPQGDQLLVGTSAPTILDIETGTLIPLPAGLEGGLHFRWSGDGSKLVFATAYCALQVVGSADGAASAVPMLGDRQPVDNPDGLAACRPTSVDFAGGRVTVPLQTTGGNDGSRTADAVVDTATGDVIALPVTGSVVGAVFDPDGNLLVRSLHEGVRTLSLFASDGTTLLVQAPEPAALGELALLAYTR
ncbi:PD40 domain-containing protein [Paractinoplanes rishiriensis]|uniref:TolB protein n=1 Tax=Paractinoplanes rishiriensis TaxID=1050105 RepID=A0A919K022_9ACTN|nr:PD40 domain-containing protein [Actinoplanes rishiriensis]GIE98401.1 hypothetical protein Ari01nite_58660 [Actinoplanes rishiriensis]